MTIEGGCYCGAIRYKSGGEPQVSLQCHCRECQYSTGGHPNAIMAVPDDNFEFTKGIPGTFTRSDLEQPVTRYFCATCGTAIGAQTPRRPESFMLKVGTMDDPSTFEAQLAIFTKDKQPFHHIPDDLPQFEERPG